MPKQQQQIKQHEQWHARMTELYPVFKAPFQNQPVEMVRQAGLQLTKLLVPQQSGITKSYFQLHAILYLIHIAERSMMFYQQRPVAKQIELLNDYATEAVQDVIQSIQQASGSQESDNQEIAALIVKYTFHLPNSPIQWLNLYRMLWSGLLLEEKLRQSEQLRLQALAEKKSRDQELRNLEAAAAIHFLVLAEKHEEALTRIRTEGLKPSLFFDYLRDYRRTDNAKLRLFWLRGLSRMMGKESQGVVSPFLLEWLNGIDQSEELDTWIAVAIDLLPASLNVLGNHYLKQGDFKHWADLHMSLGMEPWTVDHASYATVHKEHPQALLPIYHQGIETGIESKSRNGYRDAVKLMKVVRAIYLQTNQNAQWERYYAIMMERTGRLRAFQEEVEKGRLQR